MTLNVTSVVLFVAGVVLLYAGIKNVHPKDVITSALKGKSPAESTTTNPASNTKPADNSPKPTFPSV